MHVPTAAAAGRRLPLVLNLHARDPDVVPAGGAVGDGWLLRSRWLPRRVSRRHADCNQARSGSRRQGRGIRFQRGRLLRPPEHETHRRRRLPPVGHRERSPSAYTGRPAARVRHRDVERRHDGVRDGGRGLHLHRGHRVGRGPGGAARRAPDASGADDGIPQHRRSDRALRRHAEPRPAPALLGDVGRRPVDRGRRLRAGSAHRADDHGSRRCRPASPRRS